MLPALHITFIVAVHEIQVLHITTLELYMTCTRAHPYMRLAI